MEDQYGMNDLRQFITSSSNNRPNNNLYAPIPHPYDMLLFGTDPNTNTNTSVTNASTSIGGASSSVVVGGGEFSAFESGGGGVGCDGNNGRWPRQETLTLLEIRSRLDIKFKEANQKGPLWDEVSRIMSEEHGYQRSGKKCREKFENLYKYYKKTKEGKAGRQDGKHYRFFRQLEALYGETNNSASVLESNLIGGNFQDNIFQNKNISLANNQESFPEDTSLNLSNFDDSYTTSSDDSDFNEGVYGNDQNKMKRKCKRSWKVKIKDFIDAKMRILMDKQEAWMERMMTSIEKKEQERILREEEWRKQDAARIEREQKFWANERAWIEARDSELMDALQKLTGKELRPSTPEELIMASNIRSMSENPNEDGSDQTMNNNSVKVLFAGRSAHPGTESEVNRLIQLRNAMEVKFQQGLISEEVLWEEIASKMACFGHEKSGLMCKEMWDSVNEYILKCNKKRKENSKGYQNHELFCDQLGGRGYCDTSEQAVNHTIMRLNDNMNSPLNSNTGNAINDGCFRYFVGDPYGRIMD